MTFTIAQFYPSSHVKLSTLLNGASVLPIANGCRGLGIGHILAIKIHDNMILRTLNPHFLLVKQHHTHIFMCIKDNQQVKKKTLLHISNTRKKQFLKFTTCFFLTTQEFMVCFLVYEQSDL